MEDLNVSTLTEAVLDQMSTTEDPRLREIMAAAVKHLHAFAREVDLTPEEWLHGIKFMTDIGQACTPHRQEFILLSDTLGLSRMVNLLHDARIGGPESGPTEPVGTETSLLGPFYRQDSPERPLGDLIAREAKGEVIALFGQVLNEHGAPIPDATVEVWQTDPDGAYDLQASEPEVMDHRARFRTDVEGRYWFRATIPFGYTIPLDGPVGALIRAQRRHGCRPAHTHFLVGAEGHRELVTAIYYGYDQYIDTDVVFGVSNSLIVEPAANVPGAPDPNLRSICYDFTLLSTEKQSTGRVGADPASFMMAG